MKQKILIAYFLLLTVITNAQLTTNLILNPRPPARLSEWALNKATLTLIVFNQQSPKRAKIKVTIKSSDGTEVSTTNLNLAPTQTFLDGQTVLDVSTVFPLQIQQFAGNFQSSLNKTGKLPSDSYQFCVDVVAEGTFAPLATQKCVSFFVASAQLPICMMPADKQVLDYAKASTAITFRWTPLVPRPSTAVIYRLQVFEVLENQQPMQALRSNQPILDNEIIGQTQFIWQPQGILGLQKEEIADSTMQKNSWDGTIKGGKTFIWSIQSLDPKGEAIAVDANYEGRSEPVIFTVTSTNNAKEQPKRKIKYNGTHITEVK